MMDDGVSRRPSLRRISAPFNCVWPFDGGVAQTLSRIVAGIQGISGFAVRFYGLPCARRVAFLSFLYADLQILEHQNGRCGANCCGSMPAVPRFPMGLGMR